MFESHVRKIDRLRIIADPNSIQKTALMPKVISHFYFKFIFNLYFIRYDTKRAIKYKINSAKKAIKFLVNPIRKVFGPNQKDVEFKFIDKIIQAYEMARDNYQMTPYDGEIIVFHVKRTHRNNLEDFMKGSYKEYFLKYYDCDNKYLGWKPYAKSIRAYEIDGEHGSIFKPTHCKHFAQLLQQELDMLSGNQMASILEKESGILVKA